MGDEVHVHHHHYYDDSGGANKGFYEPRDKNLQRGVSVIPE